MSWISFPHSAEWNEAAQAVTFPVATDQMRGTCFVPITLLNRAAGRTLSPGEAVTEFWRHRHLFETAASRRIEGEPPDADRDLYLRLADLLKVTGT